ncbi:MAG: VanZ family protein [Caldilineales bacterium]
MTETPATTPSSRRLAWLWWLLPLGWMALIWTLSAQSDLLATVNSQLRDMLAWVAHFSEFAALAALLWLALRKTTAISRQTMLGVSFFGAALFAAIDEVHQAFVPGRTPDMRDLVVDVAGILVALAVVRWLVARRSDARGEE